MLKKYISLAILILTVITSTACGSFAENALKTADVTTLAVETARLAYANNYEALAASGKITPEDKVKIENAYAKYQVVAKSAVISIRVYNAKDKLGSTASKEEVDVAMANLSKAFFSFYDLLKAFSVIQ